MAASFERHEALAQPHGAPHIVESGLEPTEKAEMPAQGEGQGLQEPEARLIVAGRRFHGIEQLGQIPPALRGVAFGAAAHCLGIRAGPVNPIEEGKCRLIKFVLQHVANGIEKPRTAHGT